MAEEENMVTLKLLVDKKNDVVLFAEAGKDFVDFLFHILALPVGTVIRLLGKSGMVGSLGNLYDSIEGLSDTYCIQSSSGNLNSKDSLLKPKTYFGSKASTGFPLLPPPELCSSDDSKKTYYRCSEKNCDPNWGECDRDCSNYAESPSATCPDCGSTMNRKLNLVEAPQQNLAAADNRAGSDDSGGYVKGVVTYMVMDDLVVKPMSTISSITLLNKFNVTDLNCLDEKVIECGMSEAVALLEASLQSKTVLTNVFLAARKRST